MYPKPTKPPNKASQVAHQAFERILYAYKTENTSIRRTCASWVMSARTKDMRPAVCITTVNESTSHAKSISRSGLHCIQAPEVARQDDLAGTVRWIGEAQKR